MIRAGIHHLDDPLYYEDLEVGHRYCSESRTISRSDVGDFAHLTGDDNPLHLDDDFARTTPFGRPIVHGLLGLSVAAGLGSHSPLTQTAVFIRIVDWKFLRPIYAGDTLHVETEVLDKRSSGRRRGLIVWRRQLINQDGEVVQEGTTETMVLMQSRAKVLPR
jgi:acyl dehydratase